MCGITQGGQSLAGLLMFVTGVQSLSLDVAQGLGLTESFYWDLNDQTREWSARFEEKTGKKPSMIQAGVYAGVLHYLKAVEAVGSKDDGAAVVAKMKELPTEDPLFGQGEVRADGRKVHDMYLFRVKTPDQSEGAWDYTRQSRRSRRRKPSARWRRAAVRWFSNGRLKRGARRHDRRASFI